MRSTSVVADDGVRLQVATWGEGPDVVILSGGPGYAHYLAEESLAPVGFRSWFPDPRGVAESGGGPMTWHGLSMTWRPSGWPTTSRIGSCSGTPGDPISPSATDSLTLSGVRGIVGLAGHGLHRDREWSAAYTTGRTTEATVEIDWMPEVHAALWASFKEWIHQPTLWRSLADTTVPMLFIAAGDDIRPDWPLRQLAELVPGGAFEEMPDVPHHFWQTHPGLWRDTCTAACRQLLA